MFFLRPFLMAAGISLATFAQAADTDMAPPSFSHSGKNVVFVDFQSVDLSLRLDVAASTATAKARIEFYAPVAGLPAFDLVPSIKSVTLNGRQLSVSDAPVIPDPSNVTKFRIVLSEVAADSQNILEVEYELSEGVEFSGGKVRAGFFMSDLATGGREYFEQYGPTSFEYDHYQQNITVELSGTSVEHVLYANGDLLPLGANRFRVEYPSYYTTSSFYFHLVEKGRFKEARADFTGLNKVIPITVYGESQTSADQGLRDTKGYLAELESAYGPFAHNSYTAYITPGGGGMEHCGATMTSLWALGHETTHSWFARGVMPADGNAGWIDEAVASWRDENYPRASSDPSGAASNLGGFSTYKRHTTQAAYTTGMRLISAFDRMFAGLSGEGFTGMKFVLRKLFETYAQQTISVNDFKVFMEGLSGKNLDAVFQKYVYGRTISEFTGFNVVAPETFGREALDDHRHPRPFTKEELKRLL
jgi:hypothetical protein